MSGSINNNSFGFLRDLLGARVPAQGDRSPVVHSQMAEFSNKVIPQTRSLPHPDKQQEDPGLKVVQDLLGSKKPLKVATEMQPLNQGVKKIQALLGVSTGKEASV